MTCSLNVSCILQEIKVYYYYNYNGNQGTIDSSIIDKGENQMD